MKVIEKKEKSAILELTGEELLIINNSINETIEAIPEWEFPVRVGAKQTEAVTLLTEIGDLSVFPK